MTKKIVLQIVTLMILLFSLNNKVTAGEEVDFGSVTASQIFVSSRNTEVTVPGNSRGASIKVSNGLTNSQKGQKIPMERITLFWGNQNIPLNRPQTLVDFKGISPGATLNLKLELRPIDRPGCYTGEISLQFWKPDPENPSQHQWISQITTISIKVNIEAWVNLKMDTPYVKLEPITNDISRYLQNIEPVTLKLASNTDWIAYLEIDGTVIPGPLSVKIKSLSKDGRGFDQIVTGPRGRKPLATGTATVTETQYWREIGVGLSINNFTQYPAGKYRFKMHFTGEIYDEKSAVDF